MSNCFVTLLTNDLYLPGALVLLKSLKKTNTLYPIVVLVTPDLQESSLAVLAQTFDKVIKVDTIRSKNLYNLSLLGRPELDVTLTKLHVFNPEVLPYDRIAFLDADTLILQNIDNIFEYVDEESVLFAAAPDIGWPDCFNSGVFVAKPNGDTFSEVITFADRNGSFDGI